MRNRVRRRPRLYPGFAGRRAARSRLSRRSRLARPRRHGQIDRSAGERGECEAWRRGRDPCRRTLGASAYQDVATAAERIGEAGGARGRAPMRPGSSMAGLRHRGRLDQRLDRLRGRRPGHTARRSRDLARRDAIDSPRCRGGRRSPFEERPFSLEEALSRARGVLFQRDDDRHACRLDRRTADRRRPARPLTRRCDVIPRSRSARSRFSPHSGRARWRAGAKMI